MATNISYAGNSSERTSIAADSATKPQGKSFPAVPVMQQMSRVRSDNPIQKAGLPEKEKMVQKKEVSAQLKGKEEEKLH